MRGFSQALRDEIEGTRVGITVVHPEGVATSTAKNARAPEGGSAEEIGRGHAMANKLLKLPPEVAGRSSFKASSAASRAYWSGPMPSWLQ